MTNDLFRDLLHASHDAGWGRWAKTEQPPADPRARALWAKQQQGHGPAMTPLRVRGRTTHYKEKH